MMATALTKENVRIQADDLNPRVNMLELETLNCRFRFLKNKSNKWENCCFIKFNFI